MVEVSGGVTLNCMTAPMSRSECGVEWRWSPVAASPGYTGPTARVTWPPHQEVPHCLALPGYCGHCGQQNMSTLQLLKHDGQVWLL